MSFTMDTTINTLSESDAPEHMIVVQADNSESRKQTILVATLFAFGIAAIVSATVVALVMRRRYLRRHARDLERKLAAERVPSRTQWNV